MTFFLNLDEFRDLLVLWFRLFVDLAVAISLLIFFCGIFLKSIRRIAPMLSIITLNLSGCIFLSGLMLSAYMKFSHYKWIARGGGEALDVSEVLNYKLLVSEMHLYVGGVTALLFLLLSLGFKLLPTKLMP